MTRAGKKPIKGEGSASSAAGGFSFILQGVKVIPSSCLNQIEGRQALMLPHLTVIR